MLITQEGDCSHVVMIWIYTNISGLYVSEQFDKRSVKIPLGTSTKNNNDNDNIFTRISNFTQFLNRGEERVDQNITLFQEINEPPKIYHANAYTGHTSHFSDSFLKTLV